MRDVPFPEPLQKGAFGLHMGSRLLPQATQEGPSNRHWYPLLCGLVSVPLLSHEESWLSIVLVSGFNIERGVHASRRSRFCQFLYFIPLLRFEAGTKAMWAAKCDIFRHILAFVLVFLEDRRKWENFCELNVVCWFLRHEGCACREIMKVCWSNIPFCQIMFSKLSLLIWNKLRAVMCVCWNGPFGI